jgi:hypothetical protein
MPLFNDRLGWQGIGTIVALILVALAFAVVGYAEWSSEAAFDQFLNASKAAASEPANRTCCYQKESRSATASNF